MRSRNVGICHSDFELYEGRYIIPVSYPIIPGHEWSGEIAEAGSGVTSAAARAIASSGNASSTTATTTSGSRSAAPTPSTSSPRRPGCTAFPTSSRSPRARSSSRSRSPTAPPSPPDGIDASDEVAVIGGGPIGLLCAMAAATMGGSVTLIEPQAHRRALGLEVGAKRRDRSRRRRRWPSRSPRRRADAASTS